MCTHLVQVHVPVVVRERELDIKLSARRDAHRHVDVDLEMRKQSIRGPWKQVKVAVGIACVLTGDE